MHRTNWGVVTETSAQRTLLLVVLVLAVAGSGCLYSSPQIIREVQTAKPLKAKQTEGSVSGGLTWDATGYRAIFYPAIPNLDFNLLLRRGKADYKEIQVPLNIALRLGPAGDGWWGVHAASGVFFKQATLVSPGKFAKYFNLPPEKLKPADWQQTNYWVRPLYKAWIVGPTLGAYISSNYIFAEDLGGDPLVAQPGFKPRAEPLVCPFVGMYLRYVRERRRDGFVRLSGFLANISYYFLDYPMVYEYDNEFDSFGIPLGIEVFAGGFVGSERRKFISQFTYGIGTDRRMMPRLVLGLTFGSKGRRLKSKR